MPRLEFWPDYGGVLLHEEGRSVALESLDLRPDLVGRARDWVSRYDDSGVDPDGWDEAWVREGRSLFQEVRTELEASGFEVYDWEGLMGRARGASERVNPRTSTELGA